MEIIKTLGSVKLHQNERVGRPGGRQSISRYLLESAGKGGRRRPHLTPFTPHVTAVVISPDFQRRTPRLREGDQATCPPLKCQRASR